MPPLGVSANADGTDNVLRQLSHEQSKRPDRSPQRCARALADASESCLHTVESRSCVLKLQEACQKPWAKNAFDFKLIDAESGCAGSGHLSVRCLLYVRFADESCSAQEKVSCLFASMMRGLAAARPAMALEIASLTFAVRCKPAISPVQSQW